MINIGDVDGSGSKKSAEVIELFPTGYPVSERVDIDQLSILCDKTSTSREDWTMIHGPGVNSSIEVWYKNADGRFAFFDTPKSTLFSLESFEDAVNENIHVVDHSKILIQLSEYWQNALGQGNAAGMLSDFRAVIDKLEKIEQEALMRLPLSEGGLGGMDVDIWLKRLSNFGVAVFRDDDSPSRFTFTGAGDTYPNEFAAISAAVSMCLDLDGDKPRASRPDRHGI